MGTKSTAPAPPPRAAAFCRLFNLSDDGQQALREEMTPKDYLALLVERKMHSDAVQFIAHYLPKRQAVFWACQCVRASLGEKPPAPALDAVKAAETWVAHPTEENRRAAMKAAEAADTGTPAGSAALAAYWSEGPQAPDASTQQKLQFMTAKLAGAAVLLSALTNRERVKERLAEVVAQGMTIVQRTYA